MPIASFDDEINLFPDQQTLKRFCLNHGIDIALTFAMQSPNANAHAHTRVFAPRFGHLEGPATGTGNSAFGYYMLGHGLWDGSAISIEQGGSDRIFNAIQLQTQEGRMLFGGRASTRISGVYHL